MLVLLSLFREFFSIRSSLALDVSPLLCYYSRVVGPHRLAARTPGSHPGNRGSIPREVTKRDSFGLDGSFFMLAKV